MEFKIYECDFGFKYKDQDYEFPDIDSVTIDDPSFKRLTRGANAKNNVGLAYNEGSKEPKTWTLVIPSMPVAIFNLLTQIYNSGDRLDAVYCISRKDGSSKMLKNGILCQLPQQKTIDESPESMNVELIFQGFDTPETKKS